MGSDKVRRGGTWRDGEDVVVRCVKVCAESTLVYSRSCYVKASSTQTCFNCRMNRTIFLTRLDPDQWYGRAELTGGFKQLDNMLDALVRDKSITSVMGQYRLNPGVRAETLRVRALLGDGLPHRRSEILDEDLPLVEHMFIAGMVVADFNQGSIRYQWNHAAF